MPIGRADRLFLRLGADSSGCRVLRALRVPEQSYDLLPGMRPDIAVPRASRSDGSERTTVRPPPHVMTLADATSETASSTERLSVPRGTSNAV